MSAVESPSSTSIPSWKELQASLSQTPVGKALDDELIRRQEGKGAPHVHNKLRLFDSPDKPKITLYRDHAGWQVCLLVNFSLSLFLLFGIN